MTPNAARELATEVRRMAEARWAVAYEHDALLRKVAHALVEMATDLDQYEKVIIPSWKREEEDSRQTEAEAIRLLGDALDVLKDRRRTKHADDCPRGRDDFDCTCGLSDLCARIEGWLGPGEVCTRCGAIGWHQCTSEPLYMVPAPDGSRVLVVKDAGQEGEK